MNKAGTKIDQLPGVSEKIATNGETHIITIAVNAMTGRGITAFTSLGDFPDSSFRLKIRSPAVGAVAVFFPCGHNQQTSQITKLRYYKFRLSLYSLTVD